MLNLIVKNYYKDNSKYHNYLNIQRCENRCKDRNLAWNRGTSFFSHLTASELGRFSPDPRRLWSRCTIPSPHEKARGTRRRYLRNIRRISRVQNKPWGKGRKRSGSAANDTEIRFIFARFFELSLAVFREFGAMKLVIATTRLSRPPLDRIFSFETNDFRFFLARRTRWKVEEEAE